jgi:hypothetical protein
VLLLLLIRVYNSFAVIINIFLCMGHELRFYDTSHFLTSTSTCCQIYSPKVLGN